MSSISTEIDRSRGDDDAVDTFQNASTGKQRRELPPYFRLKSALDRIMAMILLVPFLPLIGLLVLLVRATSKGPGVFSQVRVGKHGHNYTMYKLRSMRCDAEVQTGPAWTQANDPRVTRLGWWLRKLHLDELPQLFNVIRGEMSLVGPRPERPEFVKVLKESIADYEQRLDVLPGITGLAQINLPPDSDLDSVRRKQSLDLLYTKEASLGLDFRLLLATAMRIVGISGELATRIARVGRTVQLPCLDDTVVDCAVTTDTVTLTSLVEDLADSNGNDRTADEVERDAAYESEVPESESSPVRRRPK